VLRTLRRLLPAKRIPVDHSRTCHDTSHATRHTRLIAANNMQKSAWKISAGVPFPKYPLNLSAAPRAQPPRCAADEGLKPASLLQHELTGRCRSWSGAQVKTLHFDVRCAPDNGHGSGHRFWSRSARSRHRAPLFDHLVGSTEERGRHSEPECFGGLEVDDKLKLGRLLHRQVCGFLTLKNAAGVNAGVAKPVEERLGRN
jgi:hypothetical protein